MWQDLGSVYAVGSGRLVVNLSVVGAEGYVAVDAVRIERVGDLPAAAEIEVSQDHSAIADGSGSVDFGTVEYNNPTQKTFIVTKCRPAAADDHRGIVHAACRLHPRHAAGSNDAQFGPSHFVRGAVDCNVARNVLRGDRLSQ